MSKQPKQPVQPTINATEGTKPLFYSLALTEPANVKPMKIVFYSSLLCMLLFTLFTGWNVGYHSDELDMNAFAKKNIKYYKTGILDTAYSTDPVVVNRQRGSEEYMERGFDRVLLNYGTAFEYMAVGFSSMMGLTNGPNEFNGRHALVQLFAIIGILIAGLIAYKIGSWRAAIFTEWLLFLTPTYFGNALFNSKDIPFAVGYIACIYFMICFLQQLPKPTWKTTIGFMLAFAFTTGIRIGGLLIMFYMALFAVVYLYKNKELQAKVIANIKPLALRVLVVSIGGMILVVLSWPYLLLNPVDHIIETIEVVKKFPLAVSLPFEGEFIKSTEAPAYYLVKFLVITIPVFMIVTIIASALTIFHRRKIADFKLELLVLFAAVFPVIYATATHMNLYCGWRHLLFIYPCMVIIAAVGLSALFHMLHKPVYRVVLIVACFLGMLHPIIWSIKNHPYEYAYFNEAEGGFKNAYNNYEMDYWCVSLKPAVDWLMEHEHLQNRKDSVTVTTNADFFLKQYIETHYPGAKIRYKRRGFKFRSLGTWTYAIFNNVFLPPSDLENDFPPGGTIHTENIDGKPVSVVLKDTNNYAYHGLKAIQRGAYKTADSLLMLHYTTVDSNDAAIYGPIGFAKASLLDANGALAFGQRGLAFDEDDYITHLALAVGYLLKEDVSSALPHVQRAYEIKPTDNYVNELLSKLKAGGAIK